MKKALIIVDVQNDFCPGGSYPVPDGDKVVEPINRLLKHAKEKGWYIYASRDWHPKYTLELDDWSPHCIQNTKGAKYHPDLDIRDDVTIISKGEDLSDAHYSAFNGDDISLNDELKKNQVGTLYIVGLATDYCVKNTAIDAIKNGYKVFVVKEGTKGINKNGTGLQTAINEMKDLGIRFITLKKALQN